MVGRQSFPFEGQPIYSGAIVSFEGRYIPPVTVIMFVSKNSPTYPQNIPRTLNPLVSEGILLWVWLGYAPGVCCSSLGLFPFANIPIHPLRPQEIVVCRRVKQLLGKKGLGAAFFGSKNQPGGSVVVVVVVVVGTSVKIQENVSFDLESVRIDLCTSCTFTDHSGKATSIMNP